MAKLTVALITTIAMLIGLSAEAATGVDFAVFGAFCAGNVSPFFFVRPRSRYPLR